MSPYCIFLLALPLVASQSFQLGRCPTPAVQANFSMEQFLGRWYTIQKMPNIKAEGRCSEVNFVRQDNNSVLVNISQKSKITKMEGLLYQDAEKSAKMEFSYRTKNQVLNASMPSFHLGVLKTDYTSMAVIYSCKDVLDMFYFEFAWIVSRKRSLPRQVVREAMAVLQREDICVSDMDTADQTRCD